MTRANSVVAVAVVAVAVAAAAGCGDSSGTDIPDTGVFDGPLVAAGEKCIGDENHEGGTCGPEDTADHACCRCLEATGSTYAGGATECAGRLAGGFAVAYRGASLLPIARNRVKMDVRAETVFKGLPCSEAT